VGCSVRGFDVIWANLAGIMSFQGVYGLGLAWTLQSAARYRIPVILFFDDWKVHQTLGQFRMVEQHQEYITRVVQGVTLFHADDVTRAVNYGLLDAIQRGCSLAYRLDWADLAWLAVCPMFKFTELSVIEPLLPLYEMDRLRRIDPSPFTPLVDAQELPRTKSREWACAALTDHRSWVDGLGLEWPVQYWGARKLKAPRLATEADVQREYAGRWGVLSPLQGRGYYRTRFLYGANGGSVVLATPEEVEPLPGYYHPPDAIEGASDRGLAVIAQTQRELLLENVWTMDEWTDEMASLLMEVRAL
jgi:hypothetical protein